MSSTKITKNDLIDSVYEKVDCDKFTIRCIFECFLKKMKESLKEGCVIELRGFGTFELRFRKGKNRVRNPKTGEISAVEPHYVVVFRAGKEIKNAVWNINKDTDDKNI